MIPRTGGIPAGSLAAVVVDVPLGAVVVAGGRLGRGLGNATAASAARTRSEEYCFITCLGSSFVLTGVYQARQGSHR